MEQIDATQVWQRLPVAAAVDALEQAITAGGFPDGPPRMHLEDAGQTLLVMPSLAGGWAGVKLVTIDPDNPGRGLALVNGVYGLFAPPGLEPVAVIDGRALTELRTAAVSGLATRYLARPGASRLVIFGAGAQGRSHLLAMHAVLDLEDVRIVAPRRESVTEYLRFASRHLEVPVLEGSPEDVANADVVCTCTSSTTPVFDGSLLPDGVHVNAIGAYRPDMQEVDATVVASSRVVVEVRESALAEKGDLLVAEQAGTWQREAIVADLTQLLRDGIAGRDSPDQRTLFASVGHAYEDLIVARAIVESTSRAVKR